MPRIDEMPEYRAKLGKSTHDLSHKFGFTATVAHLLPVFHDFMNPGETIELGVSYNLRTQPLQSAAMVDINAHVEYFFVPMPLIYEPFGSTYYNVLDMFSSNFPHTPTLGIGQFPVVDMADLNAELQSYDTDTVDFEDWVNHVYRLFDHFGFNNTLLNQSLGNKNHNPNVFPWQLLAYHAIYQYYYRLDTRESFISSKFNWDKFYQTAVVKHTDVSYKDLFRLHYRPKDSDYFTDVKVSPIVDALNLNWIDMPATNDWLTRSTLHGYDGQLPVLSSGSHGVDATPAYYMNAPTSPGNSNPNTKTQTTFGFTAEGPGQNGASFLSLNGLDVNTANIRAMFASEKLWSITGRARKHYDDQTLAHFGFKVPHDVKHEITCFGHDRSKIHIGEVISTSNVAVDSQGAITGSGGLGEIAGKGYGSLQARPHKFTAPCHGVVMAIISFVPDLTYGDTFLKCNAVANRNDFYTPEFDHLGMQPLFGYEGAVSDYANWTNIIGWQYRYEQWKRRFNRVSKAFQGTGSLDSWMLDCYAPTQANLVDANQYQEYLYQPQMLNQIMMVNYVDSLPTGDETKTYDGDPFVIDSFIHVKLVSTMSDYSLPRLDA